MVCINKIDRLGVDVEKVEEQLVENGVELEPYGGTVPVIHISAKTGLNLDLFVELLFEESKNLNFEGDIENLVEA